MGGSAFNLDSHGFTTSRMSPEKYSSLSSTILPLLELYFRRVSIPPSMPGKTSFGDLDIFVSAPFLSIRPHDAILQLCTRSLGARCKKFIYNLPTTNIAVQLAEGEVWQVDIHVVEKEEVWDLDFWMHSWGDVGMIVSSTVKAWGLRLSASRGLYIDIPLHGPFLLSYDIERVVEFLRLDWDRYGRGFDSVEEIFEWIQGLMINGERVGIKAKGKLEKKEHSNRGMWVDFWSLGDPDTAYTPSNEEKETARRSALDFFGKVPEYEEIVAKLERERVAKEKFNGNLVREWTGAERRRLGVLLKLCKEDGRLGLQRVVEMEEEEIRGIVIEIWRKMS